MQLKTILQRMLNGLFPLRCPFCGQISEKRCCAECEDHLPFIQGDVCITCGLLRRECRCYTNKPKVDQAFAPFYYEGIVRSAILRMKNGNAGIHAPLAEYMADCVDDFVGPIDLITCIPQSANSARTRGFNQSELLAKRVSIRTGIPCMKTLICVRQNIAQKSLGASERVINIAGSFETINADAVKGKSLLLVDDIKTTGSTANEAASVLKDAGANRISLLCIAFTRHHS